MQESLITDEDTDLFTHVRPAAPAVAAPRRTCLACGLFLPQVRPPLCEGCHSDAGLAQRAADKLASLHAAQEALHAAWSAYLAALPADKDDDLGTRWQKLTSARSAARSRAERPIDKGRNETLLAAFEKRLAATERKGGPLADVIQRERTYLDQLDALESERVRWERVGEAV